MGGRNLNPNLNRNLNQNRSQNLNLSQSRSQNRSLSQSQSLNLSQSQSLSLSLNLSPYLFRMGCAAPADLIPDNSLARSQPSRSPMSGLARPATRPCASLPSPLRTASLRRNKATIRARAALVVSTANASRRMLASQKTTPSRFKTA